MRCFDVGVTIVGCEANKQEALLTAIGEHLDVTNSDQVGRELEVEGAVFSPYPEGLAESLTHAIWLTNGTFCEVEISFRCREWETFVFDENAYDEFVGEQEEDEDDCEFVEEQEDDETTNSGENNE